MSIDYAQSIIFGLTCSSFFSEDYTKSETEAECLNLDYRMLDLLADVQAKVKIAYPSNEDSLLDFVIYAYLYQNDVENLRKLIQKSSEDIELVASRLGIVSLTKCILDNGVVEKYFSLIWNFSSGISDGYDMTIRKIGHILGWGSEAHAIRHIGTGETPQEIVTLALFSILRHPDSYVSAVECAMKAPKNGKLIGQIVATLMGAKLGLDNLPETWVNHCNNRKYILKLAQDMTIKRQIYAK